MRISRMKFRTFFEIFVSRPSITLRWYGTLHIDQNVCLKFGENRSVVCYCAHEHKINCEGFTQSGCYGNQHNQPQPFELRVGF